jgi:putative FmdB family regulatory protein
MPSRPTLRRAPLKLRFSYTAVMPIYDYECRKCGHKFEYLVLRTSPAAECPACQGQELTQMVSLCSMTTEGTREANWDSAYKKSKAQQAGKRKDEHKELHEHFGDGLH